MNNTAFASALCSSLATLASGSDSLDSIEVYGTSLVLEVPECLWDNFGLYSTNLTSVTLVDVHLRGNVNGTSSATGPTSSNPLMRMSTSITTLFILRCTLVDPKTAAYAPSWQAFGDRMTALTNLEVRDSPIGGTIFTTIPSQLSMLSISNSGLTGSISSSLLSLLSARSEVNLALTLNKLTGEIPGNLFSNFANGHSFESGSFDFSGNKLTGTISALLLTSNTLPSNTLHLLLGNNSLSGPLPSSMCSACPRYLFMDFSRNQLTGTISASILDTWFTKSPGLLFFSVSNNLFTGSVPSLFANLPDTRTKRAADLATSTIYLDYSYNKFDSVGLNVIANTSTEAQSSQTLLLAFNEISSLPDHFLDSVTNALVVDLTGNKLTTLPEAFLFGVTYPTRHDATVHLGQNLLTSLPSDIFNSSLSFFSLTLNFSYNPTLTGSLPSGLTSLASSRQTNYVLDFSHCGFTGAIPNMPLSNEVGQFRLSVASNRLNNGSSGFHISSFIDPSNNAGISTLDLDISDNAFVGALDITELSPSMRASLSNPGFSINASGNSFTSLDYDDDWASVTSTLDISRNTLMTTANFPESLFNASSVIDSLYASQTGIVGVFPILNIGDFSQIRLLDFSGTSGIDFCSGNRAPWNTTSLNFCKLTMTTAENCRALYPSFCQFSTRNPTATPVTITDPPTATNAPGSSSSPPAGTANVASASLVVVAVSALLALAVSV